jgi:hypothetical protein
MSTSHYHVSTVARLCFVSGTYGSFGDGKDYKPTALEVRLKYSKLSSELLCSLENSDEILHRQKLKR